MRRAAARETGGKLPVVLCWHMHQPQYRDLLNDEWVMPWTYLHGIKDYVDMAYHLEAEPGARAVVNFSPVLLEQIEHYVLAIEAHLTRGLSLPDPVLGGLAPAALSLERAPALGLLRAYLKANETQQIARFPAYQALAAEAERVLEGAAHSPSLLADLSVWFHLAWLGETVRRTEQRVAALIERGHGYSAEDRRELLELIGSLLAGLIPRYRRLLEDGRLELSISPWGHPIVPLLLDFQVALEQMPAAPLPANDHYPGGEERARWHLSRGLQSFTRIFGRRPRGCWPSEGAVSAATVALLDGFGFEWLASGEGVLRASLDHEARVTDLNQPWRISGNRPICFFRHDALSDLVGFTYATWHGDDAAANFVAQLEQLATLYEHERGRIVAVILDGENAWEHYPYNGYYFLSGIYRMLAAHPRLRLTTFSEFIDETPESATLTKLVSGSWVHGSLGTWIGTEAKNRAWEMLCDAKRCFDDVVASGRLSAREEQSAAEQLGVCEGSDWAWWFAEFNPGATVAAFDELFRRHLHNLYHMLACAPPAYLSTGFARGEGGAEHGGTMQRAD